MPDPVSLPTLFSGAEQAALRGDYAEAARLLGDAARLQETTLGTDAVELANTLNNLAVAHERSGDLDAAEREYRRAHEIAAASRPADDPLVTTSAQNLREFCEANGRPLDPPARAPVAAVTPAPAAPLEADVPTAIVPRPEIPAVAVPAPAASTRTEPSPTTASPPAAGPIMPMPRPPAPLPKPVTGFRLPMPALIALGVLALLAIWFFAGRRNGDAAQPEAAAPESVPASPPAASPPATPAPVPAPVAAPPPPPARSAASPAPGRETAPARPGTTADVPVTVADARLCTALSASYECTTAGDTVAPGRLTYLTRLIVPQDTRVVHRWYRGDELRQAVRLDVPPRRQGFRTFSRGTVYVTPGEWHVELRTLDGHVLHTVTFHVR